MKLQLTKIKVIVFLLVLVLLMGIVAFLGSSFGRHTASLSIKEVTAKALAESMQSDEFYSDYPQTMLLLKGTVKSVQKQGSDTIAEFVTENSPNVLPKVSCDLGSTNILIKPGATITILSIAYDAMRKNRADVFMSNCYLLKSM